MGKIFTDDELELLEKVKNTRSKMVDTICKDGVPENSRDLRILNEVLNSLQTDITSTANVRLKDKEVENNITIGNQLVVAALQSTKEARRKVIGADRDFKTNITSEITNVDGIDSQGVEQINPDTILDS